MVPLCQLGHPRCTGHAIFPDSQARFVSEPFRRLLFWYLVTVPLTSTSFSFAISPMLQAIVFFLFASETTCMILHYVAVHFQVNVFQPGSLGDLSMRGLQYCT